MAITFDKHNLKVWISESEPSSYDAAYGKRVSSNQLELPSTNLRGRHCSREVS